jgi:hypothetical protein
MTVFRECPHEADVLTAVSTRRWPDRAPAELVAHAAGCPVCADVLAVASAFEDDLEQAPPMPRPPDATVVWLRAQMRARIEAERLAARPITVAQAIGLAAGVGVLGAVFGASATWFQSGLSAVWGGVKAAASIQAPALPPALVSIASAHGLVFAGAIVGGLALASLAVYLTLREE